MDGDDRWQQCTLKKQKRPPAGGELTGLDDERRRGARAGGELGVAVHQSGELVPDGVWDLGAGGTLPF